MIKNRSLVTYIVLNMLTCGIYNIFFFKNMDRDINIICEGDNAATNTKLTFWVMMIPWIICAATLVMGLVTCGSMVPVFSGGSDPLAMAGTLVGVGTGVATMMVALVASVTPLVIIAYTVYWIYTESGRLVTNAPRYDLQKEDQRPKMLVWAILGSACCGIGIYVALHYVIKDFNDLAYEYNAG